MYKICVSLLVVAEVRLIPQMRYLIPSRAYCVSFLASSMYLCMYKINMYLNTSVVTSCLLFVLLLRLFLAYHIPCTQMKC